VAFGVAGNPGFGSTQWSVVLAARDGEPARAEAALAQLCTTYWLPLYLYVRRSGHAVEDAQDLTQSFFAHLLESGGLQHVDPALGKFRSFLLVSLRNFVSNEQRRGRALKRGGARQIVSLEEMTQAEDRVPEIGSVSETPERVYERNWALALLARATSRLETEFAAAGKSLLYDQLKPHLTGDREARYAEVASVLGVSEVTVRVSVHRLRARFRELVQQEVAHTLADPADAGAVEEEMRHLLSVL
jgi:RNA polymerase sigma-70 factor (ECF subfamily)